MPDARQDERGEASLVPTRFLKNLAQDQKDIWTSPFRARIKDLNWIAPAIGFSAGLMAADSELSSRITGTNTIEKHSNTLSNGGVGALVAAGGGLYLMGKWKGDTQRQEAGILAGEAAINAFIVDEVMKAVSRRERPTDGTGQGRFGKGGSLNSSFPSAHAMVSWSIASVIAHEYPGPLTQILVYGVATGVSVTRVTAQKHFPSDVVVGSALGYLIGRQVFTSHHDRQIADNIGTFYKDRAVGEENTGENTSSPYVPIDSWVYPAFDRLIALGGVHSAIQGLRPWTRQECARLLEETEEEVQNPSNLEIPRLYAALAKEFAPEMQSDNAPYISVDSVYARVTGISGQPLTDGYHFASTIVNDYGRPFQKGMNAVSGFSSSASAGAFGFYVRGELEHAPSGPAVSQTTQNAIQFADDKPIFQPAFPVASFNQFRLLDSYAMLNIKGWQASFGKQSLWLGPTRDPFLQTNNAEPMYMFRVDHTSPQKLPSILGLLGPFRIELWVGRMVGHHYVTTQTSLGTVSSIGRSLDQQPLVNGQKINFHPTPNFEFGIGKTGVFGGPDFPVTIGSLKHAFFSTGNAIGRGQDPGDRRSTFDFSYRIPGFRNWLTLYDDSFVEDEISPIGYPRRAAHNPGIYMPQLPLLPHADFRFEAAYTNLAGLIQPPNGGFFYWNTRYLDGYTNKGNIIGNGTVGRQGIAFRAESTYWVASDKTIQAGYRNATADSFFLKGGNFRDVHVRSDWAFHKDVSASVFLQYEWWNFPLLATGRQTDFTASVQLTYYPHWKVTSGK